MNELPVSIVYRSGPLNVVADTLSRRPQRDQLYLGPKDESTCAAWLQKGCPIVHIEVVCG